MFLARIDNRLIHGQVIESWAPFTGARELIVANDQLAADPLQQEILSLAVPARIEAVFMRVEEVAVHVKAARNRSEILVLFANCKDARRAYENGLGMEDINIGNLHYGPGKKQLCAHVALSNEDESCLRFFSKNGVGLDFRCVPNDTTQVKWVL